MGKRCGRHAGRMVRLSIAALAVAVSSTSCTSSNAGADRATTTTIARPQVGAGLRVSGTPKTVRVYPSKALDVAVGKVAVEGPAGAFGSTGKISVAPVEATAVPAKVGEAPTTGEASGVVVELGRVDLSGPLTVRFTLPAGAAETVGVAHVADDGTWTPVASTVEGDAVIASTDEFSSVVVFGIDIGAVFDAVGSFVVKQFAGRSDAPSCTGGPPWAAVTAVPSGAVHSCVRSNTDTRTGAVRAELEIKSNRGTYQWVALPSEVKPDYVWVEDQPDWLRQAIGSATDTDWMKSVLLNPGGRMTVGYHRPATGKQVTARAYPDVAAVYMSAFNEVWNFYLKDKVLGPFAAAWCLDLVNVDLAAPVTTWGQLPSSASPMIDCFIDKLVELRADPAGAVQKAAKLIAPNAPTGALTKAASVLSAAGTAAIVVQLSGLAARVLTQTLDAALDAFGFDNVGDATLTLTGAPRGLVLGEDSIGDITFGTDGAEARRRLVAALGETSEPDAQITLVDCRPIPSTIMRWGDFWVGLVGPPGNQTLSGYELFGRGDARLSTAEGVTVGERYEDFVHGFDGQRPSASVTEDSTYRLDAAGPEIEMSGQEFGDKALRISAGVVPACYE